MLSPCTGTLVGMTKELSGKCRVCGGRTSLTHRGVILGKYAVDYHLCEQCEFWCTEEPFWLEEAYSEAIAATDTGLVQRNVDTARQLRVLLTRLFPKGPYVDWAGGHGTLVRLMRDAGFEFYWQDKYATNLFARGFDWNATPANATAVTAIEVLEHCPNPIEFLRECIEATGTSALVFSQELHTGGDDSEWWYLSPVTGQHVAFYTEKTLSFIADQLAMSYSRVAGLHMFATTPVGRLQLRTVNTACTAARSIARLDGLLSSRRSSLTWPDHLSTTRALASQDLHEPT